MNDNWTTICELNGQRWLLGPEGPESMTWDDATDWCESVGGVLPPREVLLIASCLHTSQFTARYYWSSSESNSNAWYQNVGKGTQYRANKFTPCLVRAVRSQAL